MKATTLEGFSDPRLCLIDEASIVSDSVMTALLPMLIVSGGRLMALSTPKGKRGWFYEQYVCDSTDWLRINAARTNPPSYPSNDSKNNADRWVSVCTRKSFRTSSSRRKANYSQMIPYKQFLITKTGTAPLPLLGLRPWLITSLASTWAS